MHPHHVFECMFKLIRSTDDEYIPNITFAFQTKPYICLLQTDKVGFL